MRAANSEHSAPWYREPYVWLVLAPLVVVIIGGFTTLGIAIRAGGDDAMPGVYRSAGKLIALDPEALIRSERIAPALRGRLDAARGILEVRSEGLDALPTRLEGLLVHATRPADDVTLTLVLQDGMYRAVLPERFPDRGEFHLYPGDRAWRVVAGYRGTRELVFSAGR